MPRLFQIASLLAIVSIAICVCALRPAHRSAEPWRGLAKRIVSKGHADSTAVIVLFDEDILDSLRSRLPGSFAVVLYGHPGDSQRDDFVPRQLGQMYRETFAATAGFPDVWVVGRFSISTGRKRARWSAEASARSLRRRVLRDSVESSQGTVTFSRWVDVPGGAAGRANVVRAQAYADSVLARGLPKRIPITGPFTASELEIDPDTLSHYLAKLADTSFYSIGGCSDVEIVSWTASEHLGILGPGVVPSLVGRITDPDPFARARVEDALNLATQDERILARTNGEYLELYDGHRDSSRQIVRAWWTRFGHYWVPADSAR